MLSSPRYPLHERYQCVTTYYRRSGGISWFYSGIINGTSKRSCSPWNITGWRWITNHLNYMGLH